MPNWCNCSLTISGARDKIDQIVQAAIGELGETEDGRLIGMLEYMVPVVASDGEVTASDQTAEWGTKWDVTDAEVLDHDVFDNNTASALLAFDTAWSPPIECFETWFGENEDCDCVLDYHEPGMTFVGRFTPERGEETWEYGAATADTVRDLVPEEIVDLWDLEDWMYEMEDADLSLRDEDWD